MGSEMCIRDSDYTVLNCCNALIAGSPGQYCVGRSCRCQRYSLVEVHCLIDLCQCNRLFLTFLQYNVDIAVADRLLYMEGKLQYGLVRCSVVRSGYIIASGLLESQFAF